jgi:glycosyltransferase involved in cell wall biosynthesis
MRIWILNHYASPPDRPAGTRHYELGRVLASQGHDITIFASSFCHFSRQEERLEPGERIRVEFIDGVRFVWIRTTPYSDNDHHRARNMMSYALGVVLANRRFERPDVIVGSSVHLAAVAAAFLIGQIRRVPFVFEVRDVWPQALIDMGALREGGAIAKLLTKLERFLYRRARMIITLLPKAAQHIEQFGIPGNKVVYVPNGIADYCHTIHPTSDDTRALMVWITKRREAGCMIAGYVGSHGPINGIDVLVDAARELRDRGKNNIAFIFIGDGPEKGRCEQLAREYHLANVLFWRPVPKRVVPTMLQALDVMLFCLRDIPVFKFGLSSNKLFDYLASGRPIVAACSVADNPVNASGGGICVPPESPGAVGEALLELAALDDASRRAIGERGTRWVYQNHGTTDLAERFLAALVKARC